MACSLPIEPSFRQAFVLTGVFRLARLVLRDRGGVSNWPARPIDCTKGHAVTLLSIRTLRTFGLTAAAALAVTLSLPAAATNDQATSTAQPPAPAGDEASADRRNQRRICVRADFTGSRLLRTVCKTEAQWEAEGGVPGRE